MRWLPAYGTFVPKRLPVFICLLLLIIPALADFTTPEFHCRLLSTLLPENVFFPGSENYNASTASYYSLQTRLSPTCVVIPSTAEDVSTAVKTLAELPDAIFAVRGGGHSPNIGFADTEYGVTIDLSRLNHVNTNEDGTVASVGPGARWTEVHRALDPLGLDVVGGKIGTVGVGGLITGGGVSNFSPMRGWACDNVLNMQVVLASGEIVDVNDEGEYADLFVALKGGQGNFGIVTRFDLRPFRQDPYWGGLIFYPSSTEQAQVDAYAEFRERANHDSRAEVEQNFMYLSSDDGSGDPFCMNNMFYSEQVRNPSALRMFSDIQPQFNNTMRISNSTDFTEELGTNPFPHNRYLIQACTTFRFSPAILPQILKVWIGYRDEMQSSRIPNIMLALTILDVPVLLPTSRNSLGFPRGSQPDRELALGLISVYWLSDEYSSMMERATRTLLHDIDVVIAKNGLSYPYRYINYANAAYQDPLRGYGRKSLQHLVRMSKKYDPNRVFQEKVPGGWKLPLDEFS